MADLPTINIGLATGDQLIAISAMDLATAIINREAALATDPSPEAKVAMGQLNTLRRLPVFLIGKFCDALHVPVIGEVVNAPKP